MTEAMKITVVNNQTIYDLAVEYYGTVEAVGEILTNNPDLRNDQVALVALGIDYLADDGLYLDAPIAPGSTIEIDTSSPLCDRQITKELTKHITTYGTDS